MMAEKELLKNKEETCKFTQNSVSIAVSASSINTASESLHNSRRTFVHGDSISYVTGAKSEPVTQQKQLQCPDKPTSASEKVFPSLIPAHLAESYVFNKTAHVPSGITSVISIPTPGGTVVEESQNICLAYTSLLEKPGTPEPSFGGKFVQRRVECAAEADADNERGLVKITHMETIQAASTSKEAPPFSGDAKTAWENRQIMEAQENSRNNNIDKPVDTCVNHSLVNEEENQTGSDSTQTWSRVTHVHSDKFKFYPLSSDIVDATTRQPTAGIDVVKSGLLLRTDSEGESGRVATGLQSHHQSLPIVTLTVSEPKHSVTLHGASVQMPFVNAGQFSTRKDSKESPLVTEPMKLTMATVLAPPLPAYTSSSQTLKNGVGVLPSVDLSVSEMTSSLNHSPASESAQDRIELNTDSQAQRDRQVFEKKSSMSHSVHRTPEHVKLLSVPAGESRTIITSMPHSSGLPETKLTVSCTHFSAGQKSSSAGHHSESMLSCLTSMGQLSGTGDRVIVPYRYPSSDKDSETAVSLLKEATPKLVKKSHSRSPKPKSQKAAQLAADDDDDDNDFIPVGMLQLSALKRSDDKSSAVANVEFHSAEKNTAAIYQMNQGLNVIYKQPINVVPGQARSTEKPGIEEVNVCVQEKLKQKVQQEKLKQKVQHERLKQLASVSQQQNWQLLKDTTAEQQEEQGLDSQQQHLLLQLVQQAQQQQRQLQDHQQHLQQSLSTLPPPASPGQSSISAGFLKNQGLIIHHHQAQDVRLQPGIQGSSHHSMVPGQDVRSEVGMEKPSPQEFSTQQLREVTLTNSEKSDGTGKSQKQPHKDERYAQHQSALACSSQQSGQLQQEAAAAAHHEPLWHVQSSNIPKIAERLLQQSLNEPILPQARPDQLLSQPKRDQLPPSASHYVIVSGCDPVRPVTSVSVHQTLPSVNQQHPEIARMLSSPVSPRQPASPRQVVSPRRIASPIQSSTSSSQSGHQHLVCPSPRPLAVLHQSGHSKSPISINQTSPQTTASLKQVGTPQQMPESRQIPNTAHSSSHSVQLSATVQGPQLPGQSAPVHFPANQRQFEQSQTDLIQPVAAQLDKPQYSGSEQSQYGEVRIQHTPGHKVIADVSITLPNSDIHEFTSLQTIPLSQSVHTSSPGQIIHYRPPENTNPHIKIFTGQKSQSSHVQFLSPTVTIVRSPVPLTQTANSGWHPSPGQADSEMGIQVSKAVSSCMSEPVNIKRSDRMAQAQQVGQSHSWKQLLDGAAECQGHETRQEQDREEQLPVSLSVSSKNQTSGQDKCDKVQLKPTLTPLVHQTSTPTDVSLTSPYVMSAAHSRNFQTIANLTEKEASFLQSLFASTSPVPTDERIQNHPSQEPYLVSQTQISYSHPLEEAKRSSENCHIHTASASVYSDMRKNEGGLKVLSEIASKCYALDVAGKDIEIAPQADGKGLHEAVQKSCGIPELAHLGEQTLSENSMIVAASDTDRDSKTHKKTGEAHKTHEAETEYSHVKTKLINREAQNVSVTLIETPRREVRQRKPKKPFEQEEASAKRSSKTSPYKVVSKKQQPGASTLISTPKKGHGQKDKIAETNVTRDVEEEENKPGFTQTSSETRHTLAEGQDTVVEENEHIKQVELDSQSRRLSKRLQEKELMESHKKVKDETGVPSEQPSRPSHKEDVYKESTQAMTTRSSRRASMSSADDNLLPEASERMITRSKNRSADDKAAVVGKMKDNHKQSPHNSTEQKKSASASRTSTPSEAISSNKENRRETRNTLKSPKFDSQSHQQGSKSQSPARLAKTEPTAVRRMTTRQTVADLESSGSHVATKSKRLLPQAPPDELLQWQKKVKKLELPSVVLESCKVSDGKTTAVKEMTQADVGNMKETALQDIKPEIKGMQISQSKKKKQTSKKRKHGQNGSQTTAKQDGRTDDSEHGEDMTVSSGEDHHEKTVDSAEVEHEFSSQNQKDTGTKQVQSASQTIDKHSEDISSFIENGDHIDIQADEVQKESKDELHLETRREDMDLSESRKQTSSEEVAQVVEAATIEQLSVIKCTSAFVNPAAKIKLSPSTVPSSASTEACLLSPDKSLRDTTPPGKGRKMLMFKLVAVVDEDAYHHTEESLVPFSGFLISDENGERVLIPDNLVRKPALAVTSPIAAEMNISSTIASSLIGLSPTLVTPALSDLPMRSTLSSNRSLSSSLAPEVVCTSRSTFEWLPTVYSPLKTGQQTTVESTLAPVGWSSSSPAAVVSPVAGWTSQWSSGQPQSTPPLSAGEDSLGVAAKKSRLSSSVTQPSQFQYSLTPAWSATSSPMTVATAATTASSSSSTTMQPLSPLPTSSSAWDSPATMPLPPLTQQQQQQTWNLPSHHSLQENPWSSSSLVTEAAVDSWSKEYFPGAAYKNTVNPRASVQLQHEDTSAPQTVLPSSGYSPMGAGSGQQPQTYISNHDPTGTTRSSQQPQTYISNHDSAGTPDPTFGTTGPPADPEFVDNRHDGLIQSFLRQVASNPGGFSQELAGFNLGQQDLAYLESRLRQSLSPNTLFSAVAAYDDASGQGTMVGHDTSLQESVNLVHTVNLDMEDGHLDGSNNLDLSDLRNSMTPSLTMSRHVDDHRSNHNNTEEELIGKDGGGGATRNDNSAQQDGSQSVTTNAHKNDGKKSIRERKSQYEIVIQDDMKRYRCLLCDKNFGVATIYRHLRTHDPDYKVSCSLCGKQYTQRQSLVVHWMKTHSDQALSPDLMTSPRYEELPHSEQGHLSQTKPSECLDDAMLKASGALIRSPDPSIKSPSDPKRQRRTSSTSDPAHGIIGISKQEAAHQQVEQLRRQKAQKKLAAAQRKIKGHVGDDGIVEGEGSIPGASDAAGCSHETMYQTGTSEDRLGFGGHGASQDAVALEQNVGGRTPCPLSTVAAEECQPATSVGPASYGVGYTNLAVMKPQSAADGQSHFSSPQNFMPSVTQFHVDNIPKPISTPVVKSNRNTEAGCPKEAVLLDEEVNLNAVKADGKYACQLCTTILNTKSGYVLHMRRHNNVKTKFCSYCNKGFHTAQELRSHERTHTGERPYKCEICHTTFAHSGSYVSHKKSHEKRGETEPFPVIDGKVEYPPSFRKPRLTTESEGRGKQTPKVNKRKGKTKPPEIPESEQPNHNLDFKEQEASQIHSNNLDNLHGQSDLTARNVHADMPGRWDQHRLSQAYFQPDGRSPRLENHNMASDSLRVVTAPQSVQPQEPGGQGFVSPSEDYSSTSGSMPADFYSSSSAGYSHNMVGRQFLPTAVDTSSPQVFYKQDKYSHRSSSLDTYRGDSHSQGRSLSSNLAMEKNLQYSNSTIYPSSSSQNSTAYYSPHQQSSDYPYSVAPESEDYQPDDYEDSLAQYKNDPSSSEIVKKLLQHYNVPASSFQDTVPVDYSHQIPAEPEYGHTGCHGTVTEYSQMDVGRSTPAPPPYNASVHSQQKLYFSSQPSAAAYESSMFRQQPLITQDQAARSLQENSQQQQLQPHVMTSERQFDSSCPQGQPLDVYSSDRYSSSSSQSNQSTHFTSPALP